MPKYRITQITQTVFHVEADDPKAAIEFINSVEGATIKESDYDVMGMFVELEEGE